MMHVVNNRAVIRIDFDEVHEVSTEAAKSRQPDLGTMDNTLQHGAKTSEG